MGPIAQSSTLLSNRPINTRANVQRKPEQPATLLDVVSRELREAWLGDLVEGSFLARPAAIRRWLSLFLLRLGAVTFVFGVPWVLSHAQELGPRWLAATVMLVAVTPVLTHRRWNARARSVLGYGLFLGVACPLVVGWSGPAAFMGFVATGTLLMLAAVYGALSAGDGER